MSFIDNTDSAIYHFHFCKLFDLVQDILIKKSDDRKSIEQFILIKLCFLTDAWGLQGSVLGLLLFNIVINGLEGNKTVEFITYAFIHT